MCFISLSSKKNNRNDNETRASGEVVVRKIHSKTLPDNEFADQAKQAINDAAGTSGVFIAL